MTGNVALDVAIGLVFIYTLYSLLTTTLAELISVIFRMRAKHLKHAVERMLDDDDKPALAEIFNNTPVIKYLNSNMNKKFSTKKKYPTNIPPSSFSQGIIFLLKEGSHTEKPAKEIIHNSLKKFRETETGRYIEFLFNEVNGDIEKFTLELENWYETTMERCTSWYKRNLYYITLGLGFLMAMLFNIDSFQMVGTLSKDPKVREEYVQLAGQMLQNPVFTESSTKFDTTLYDKLITDSAICKKFGNNNDSIKKFAKDSVDKHVNKIKNELIARVDTIYKLAQNSQSILTFKRAKCPRWFFNSWGNFLGCLVTAIALSLGSPFWFDILKKLMSLRSSLTSSVSGNQELKKEKDKIRNAVG